jgi:flagellar protein FliO/FliZ
MFETLFGSELPLAARFFIAFLVVLALIGLTAWLVRRFGANRLGGAARGRQPRLAVIDAATVDGRRRLVLIRRDNVEHLLMIGGPTDVVVEPNIVRATGARDLPRDPARIAVPTDTAARPSSNGEGSWPLQPTNEPPPIQAPRPSRSSATEEPWLPPEPVARTRSADSLSGMAAEFSTRLTPPEVIAPAARSEPAPRPTVTPVPPPIVEPVAPAQTDHNLAEMAQQLEAALRRTPMPESRPPVTDPLAAQSAKAAPARDLKPRSDLKFEPKIESKIEPKFENKFETKFELIREAKIEPAAEPKVEPKPAPAKAPLDSLEEEMANLLGRPSGKT